MKGDYSTALEFKHKRIKEQNKVVTSIFSKSVSDYQRDYVQSQLDHSREIMRERTHRNYLILLFSLFLLCAAVIIVRQRILRKNLLIQSYIDSVSQLKQDLESSTRKSRKTIQHLFQKSMERIDKLSEELYNDSEPKMIKNKIYEELMEEVSTIRNPAFFENLATTIDEDFDGLISRIQGCGLITKEKDLRLLCLMIAGFSVKSICLLLDVKDCDIIYKRRKRLKDRISSSNEPFKHELLQLLS